VRRKLSINGPLVPKLLKGRVPLTVKENSSVLKVLGVAAVSTKASCVDIE
jgi:hypothetical protein